MIKVLVFDLDDTLLNRKKKISAKNKSTLESLMNQGFRVVLCTSRPLRSIRDFLPHDFLSLCHVLSLNGLVWGNEKKNTTFKKLPSSIKTLFNKIKNKDVVISVETDGLLFSSNQKRTDDFDKYQSIKHGDFILPENIDWTLCSKIAIDGRGSDISEIIKEINDLGFCTINGLNKTFTNVVPEGFDKVDGLKILLNNWGVSFKELMSFGDDLPDLKMLKASGVSVAMGNATEEVKSISDYIIGDCDSEAIAEFLNNEI